MRFFCAYCFQVVVLISLLAQSYGEKFIVTIDIEFRQQARVSCSFRGDKVNKAPVAAPQQSHGGQRFYEFVIGMKNGLYSCCFSHKNQEDKVLRAHAVVYNEDIAQYCGSNQYSSDLYCIWKVKDDGVYPPSGSSPIHWSERQYHCEPM